MERTVDHEGVRLSYSVDGRRDSPTILFINSIGTTRELWSRQTAGPLSRHHLQRAEIGRSFRISKLVLVDPSHLWTNSGSRTSVSRPKLAGPIAHLPMR